MKNPWPILCAVLGVIFYALALMEPEHEIEQHDADRYCEMVELFNASGGQYGWPDFNETFEKECNI